MPTAWGGLLLGGAGFTSSCIRHCEACTLSMIGKFKLTCRRLWVDPSLKIRLAVAGFVLVRACGLHWLERNCRSQGWVELVKDWPDLLTASKINATSYKPNFRACLCLKIPPVKNRSPSSDTMYYLAVVAF